MSAHDFEFQTITGEAVSLASFKGSPVLIVNTASRCGFTPQYRELQGLWERYKSRGLVVIGVPSNDFGAQEPGSEAEVLEFCEVNYGVDFLLTAKQSVIGEAAHPFYQWIGDVAGEGARPRWNFHKYLIGPDGELVNVYPSKTSPMDAMLIAEIEDLLDA
ncbi:MAG: glutathione peroxidase [Parvibaculum sp.]